MAAHPTVSISLNEPKTVGTNLELATDVLGRFVQLMDIIAGPNASFTHQPRIIEYADGKFTITLPPHQMPAATELTAAIAASSLDDLTFSKSLDGISPEAIEHTVALLTRVSEADLTLGLITPDVRYQFENADRAWASIRNFSPDNILESEKQVEGHFAAYLPTPRRAQFHRTEAQDTIYATVHPGVADSAAIQPIIGKPCVTLLHARTVGAAPTRYLIKEFSPIK